MNYIVSNGKKSKSYSAAEIMTAVHEGRMSSSVFVKSEDGGGDWEQLSTVDWLPQQQHAGRPAYCNHCHERVVATRKSLEDAVTCPSCGLNHGYLDYGLMTAQDLPLPHVQYAPAPSGLLRFTVLAGLIGGLYSLYLLFAGSQLIVLVGFLLSVVGLVAICFSQANIQSIKPIKEHLHRVDDLLTKRTEASHEAITACNVWANRYAEAVKAAKEDADRQVGAAQVEADAKVSRANQRAAAAQSSADQAHKDRSTIAERFITEHRKWWTGKLKPDNYAQQKAKIEKAIAWCRDSGHSISKAFEQQIWADFDHEFQLKLRADAEKQRQKEIRQRLKDEEKARRAALKAEKEAQAEQVKIEKAIAAERQRMKTQHFRDMAEQQRAQAENEQRIAALQVQLQEAQEKGERAVSNAQLTRAGWVYIISNIGSLGENVFKVGLTRRDEPDERVKELSGASVPLPFDIHALIFSEDAPALERAMHAALNQYRVNRVNMRKEFFRVDLETIVQVATQNFGEIEYTADVEALQYQQSLSMTDEEFNTISRNYQEIAEEFSFVDEED